MKHDRLTIEMASLKRAETIYRSRLVNTPENTETRIKLAWCLFMQALYRAGQESMLAALISNDEDNQSDLSQRSKFIWDQDAGELINDCLQQTSTVLQLSASSKERLDANRLQSLVKMSGGEQAVAQAREASSRLLGEVLQELLRNESLTFPSDRSSSRMEAERNSTADCE